MGAFTDLLAKLDERCTRLDQIIEAIADIRRLLPPRNQKRSARQLQLPFWRAERLRRKAASTTMHRRADASAVPYDVRHRASG
jgi:hypothetical protein